MKKLFFLMLMGFLTISCGNNSPEAYFENISSECEYVEAAMGLANEIESKFGFACNCSEKYNEALLEMNEDDQQDLKIHILALLQIGREIKLNARNNDDWNSSDLQNCPNFNKFRNVIDPFDEMSFYRDFDNDVDALKESGYPEDLIERWKAIEAKY